MSSPMRCPHHGLMFDPEVHTGCVICRRGDAPATPPAARRSPPWILGAAGGATLLVVAVGLFTFGGGDDSAEPSATAATPAPVEVEEGASAAANYVKQVRRLEQEVDVDTFSRVMADIKREIAEGSLDVAKRRVELQRFLEDTQDQQRAFAALSPPEGAERLHELWSERWQLVVATTSGYIQMLDQREELANQRRDQQSARTREDIDDLTRRRADLGEDIRRVTAETKRVSDDYQSNLAAVRAEEKRLLE